MRTATSDEASGHVMADPSEHREDVVRRLLDRGMAVTTLRTLFPDWDELIDRVAEKAASADTPEATTENGRIDDDPRG